MPLAHDLHDFKLDTTFESSPECILHKSHQSDRDRGIRKLAVEERWVPRKPELGFGMFGMVRLEEKLGTGDSTRRTQRAVKQLYKRQMKSLNVDFKKELLALMKFSRPKYILHFVEFLGWFEDDERIYLAMEYFPLGTLKGFINDDMKEQDAREISLQLLEGLKSMHEEGFTHRDLKPDNIFVVQSAPQWWVKIGDFGITKRISNNDTALHTATGTPYYQAPEITHFIIDGHEDTDVYTNAVDIWSLACLIYELLALQIPFPKYPRSLITFCHGGSFPEGPLVSRVSMEAIEFIKSTLIPQPMLRPSAAEILRAEWFWSKADEDFQRPPDTNLHGSNMVDGVIESLEHPAGINSDKTGYQNLQKSIHTDLKRFSNVPPLSCQICGKENHPGMCNLLVQKIPHEPVNNSQGDTGASTNKWMPSDNAHQAVSVLGTDLNNPFFAYGLKRLSDLDLGNDSISPSSPQRPHRAIQANNSLDPNEFELQAEARHNSIAVDTLQPAARQLYPENRDEIHGNLSFSNDQKTGKEIRNFVKEQPERNVVDALSARTHDTGLALRARRDQPFMDPVPPPQMPSAKEIRDKQMRHNLLSEDQKREDLARRRKRERASIFRKLKQKFASE